MATVTITLTDRPTGEKPDNIHVKVLCEPGIEVGVGAEPLTPAQSLALRMIEAGGDGKLTGASGQTHDPATETLTFRD